MKNSSQTLAKRNALRKHWRDTTSSDSFPRVIHKKCKACEEVKPHTWASCFTQGRKPEYKHRCDDCMKVYHRERAKRRRPQMTSLALDRKYLRKTRAVSYLGGRCRRCGYDKCIKAMTFHHRQPSDKDFSVSQMLDRSWDILRNELDKCDLLCFNCHMEEHCAIDQSTRVAVGAPKRRGCNPHEPDGRGLT